MRRAAFFLPVFLAACSGAYNAQNFTQQAWAKKSFDESFAACRHETVRAGYKKSTMLIEHGYDDVVENDMFISCMDKAGYRYKSPYWPTWLAYEQPKGHPKTPDGRALVAPEPAQPDGKPAQDKSALYE